jgi:hypothetical protein
MWSYTFTLPAKPLHSVVPNYAKGQFDVLPLLLVDSTEIIHHMGVLLVLA